MESLALSRYVCRSCMRAVRASHVAATPPLATSASAIARTRPFTSVSPSRRRTPRPAGYSQAARQAREFTAATALRDTKAVLNPRRDEDGNEMTVDITPRASHRLAQIMDKESNPDLALRVTVESGGCHGFQYLMSLINMAEVDASEDTVFESDGRARVVLDEPSLDLLKGSKVDYTMELIGSQFKITDNPLATSSCGCGTSFDIKAA